MSSFGIDGYEPRWLNGARSIRTAHGRRLHAMTGRPLSRIWLLWDVDADEWFADGPVLLDFDGEQVEVDHQKFDDLSITWNTVDPAGSTTWTDGDDPDHALHLRWRDDALPGLTALHGRRLDRVELLECVVPDLANGMVAPSFVLAHDRVTISNALDENGIEFGAPGPGYRTLSLA